MAVSKAQQDCVNRYKRAHYARIALEIPIEQKPLLESKAAEKGLSVNGYIKQLIKSDLHLTDDQWKNPAE